MLYDDGDLFNYLSDVFNGLTYTLVKYYDFTMPELVHFFELYERETEYVIRIDFADAEQFDSFKKFVQTKYYKDMFGTS